MCILYYKSGATPDFSAAESLNMSRINLVAWKGSGNNRALSFIGGGIMHSVVDLRNLAIKPKINDISLKVLSDYYQMFLYPFIYNYHIKTENENKDIELRFELENFCHLLGIETIVKHSVPYGDLHNYKGKDGWDNVTNLVIDIAHLKRLNKRKFLSVKAKYVYFYLIPELLEKPMAVKYDTTNVVPQTRIECEILFYSNVKGDNAIIHLGIEKSDEGYYIPRTFFVEKVSKKEEDIYIKKQEDIEVKVKNRIIMQGSKQ